jgi:hypothetical protein
VILVFYINIDDRIRAICAAMNLRPVIWDFDSRDYLLFSNPNAFPNNGIENEMGARAATQSGLISLHHDLYELAARRTPGMIDQILVNKMTPMPVSECINSPQVYSNANLVIPKSMSRSSATSVGFGFSALAILFLALQ